MIDILYSAEEIQNFIEDKMEKSSDGSQKSHEKLGAESRHSTDNGNQSIYGGGIQPNTIGSTDFNADLNMTA